MLHNSVRTTQRNQAQEASRNASLSTLTSIDAPDADLWSGYRLPGGPFSAATKAGCSYCHPSTDGTERERDLRKRSLSPDFRQPTDTVGRPANFRAAKLVDGNFHGGHWNRPRLSRGIWATLGRICQALWNAVFWRGIKQHHRRGTWCNLGRRSALFGR